MVSDDAVIHQLLQRISDRVAEDIRDSVSQTVQSEVTANLSNLLLEGEFYRNLNQEMRNGLKNIYAEIADARKDQQAGGAPNLAGEVAETGEQVREDFREASDQLDAVLQSTEQATVEIMEVVERHMELSQTVQADLATLPAQNGTAETVERLQAANQELSDDLMKIMTTLSFQDLTGQRIARIVTALRRVEDLTFNLFMSTSLKIKAKKDDPDKNYEELDRETKARVESLKGPQNDVNQNDIDDLLAQMGLE